MNRRTWASIPVPHACKVSALPHELVHLISNLAISLVRYLQFEFNYENKSFEFCTVSSRLEEKLSFCWGNLGDY
eukprot:UN17086